MTLRVLLGWTQIATMTPYSESTLKRKYGLAMQKRGVVIKSYVGTAKRCIVWAYPRKVEDFFCQVMKKQGRV